MISKSHDIGTLLHLVSSSLNKQSDRILSDHIGIGLSQFRILLLLLSQDGIKQNILANRLNQTEASISRQIGLLKQKRLISVINSSSSKREKLIYLTEKGAMVTQSSASVLNSYHQPILQELGPDGLDNFMKVLIVIQKHLKRTEA